jgi:orotate phosphoribosyltransferase
MDRLLELLCTHSVRHGPVVLASGKTSDFFVDCKQTVLLAEGHALAGRAMLDALARLPAAPVAVAGVELGGCPLASAVALLSHQRGAPLNAVYVRKDRKDHGSRRSLEGDSALAPGAPVALLEDVITTGGSTLAAARKLRERGLTVAGVIALVDRGEGGAEALEAADLPFIPLYRREDFPATAAPPGALT